MAWLLKIFKSFFFSLDSTLFNFINTLYNILMSISRTSVLTQGDIATLVRRIELLLGIFMLFKITFSFITYIVNPDDFSDKSKGFGKLMQNTVISLVMLVAVPYIFQMAYSLQAQILEGNILAELILGTKDEGSDYLTTAGSKLSFYTMIPFFKPNYSIPGLENCLNLYDDDGFSDECKNALDNIQLESNDLDEVDINNYKYGVENKSLGLTFRMAPAIAIYKATSGDEFFVFDYKWPLSTVVAVVVCLLLVTFCIDIGVRSIKLAFLQLVYPIPVISFMDPKGGKDGLFKKWYQMCFSTYLSLFIRLLALYFGIYIISKVGDLGLYDIVNGSQNTDGMVFIFIIIGILMFIKQLPKILENLGFKIDGGFTLNPLKKMEKDMLGGGLLKKPNQMLGKLGKGIVFAAPRGLSTLGKKTIGGIDASRHGKGFKQGWDRTHGNLHNNFYKKLDEWAPDSAETRKKEREAKEFEHQQRRLERLGERYYKINKDGSYDLDKNGNRQMDSDKLKSELKSKNSKFAETYQNVDDAKGRMYSANAAVEALKDQISNGLSSIARENMARQLGIQNPSLATDQDLISALNKIEGNTKKLYDQAVKDHEKQRQLHRDLAELEDAFSHVEDSIKNEKAKMDVNNITKYVPNKEPAKSNNPEYDNAGNKLI